MNIIDTILRSDLFLNDPPVLLDIGASGEINPKWKSITKYAVCIAFEPDDRELKVNETHSSSYRKLFVFNRIVTTEDKEKINFYLTSSPFCSSTLKPDLKELKNWSFHSLFTVERKTELPAITLHAALKKIGINSVDWFKADTQGTDLRLFKSILPYVKGNILAAEFEPGIIDAYEYEDKLHEVLSEMTKLNYWLSSMNLKGSQRISSELPQFSKFAKKRIIRNSACWAELTYLHHGQLITKRESLLLFIFAILEKQFGFALEVADTGTAMFKDPIFEDCRKSVIRQLKIERLKIPLVIIKKQLTKLFAGIND